MEKELGKLLKNTTISCAIEDILKVYLNAVVKLYEMFWSRKKVKK